MLDHCARERIAAVVFGGGSSVVGGVETKIAGDYRGVVTLDLGAAGARARDRPRLARRARAGRRARPGARGPAAAARAHPAPLPAVVRVQLAGRLDRHPQRRSLRDPLHARGRVRRGAARRDTHWCRRDAAPAGLGRRAVARPLLHRLGGHARRDHRGLDAPAGPADPARQRERALRQLRGRRARGARAVAVRARARELPAARSGRGGDLRGRLGEGGAARAGLRVGRPRPRAVDAPRRRAVPRPRRRAARRRAAHPHRRRRDARGRRRRLAQLVHQRALPARRAGLDRHPRRDLRDRDHLGPLRAPARARHDGGAGRAGARLRRGLAHLPLHPRLPRRARRRTTRCSRPPGAAPSSSSGTR